MTTQRSFKSRIRTRMGKTGESYTTARRNLLAKVPVPETPPTPTPPPEPVTAMGQRLSDHALRLRSGRGWDEWFSLLDAWNATVHKHGDIVNWLMDEHGTGSWSAQSITSGYEQARGLRVPGQQADGGFATSASRTIAVPVEQAFAAFADDELREQWLPDIKVRTRTATAPKSFRADWGDGPSRIAVGFTPKGEGKTQVAIIHEKLDGPDAVAEMKPYWRAHLDALKAHLEAS